MFNPQNRPIPITPNHVKLLKHQYYITDHRTPDHPNKPQPSLTSLDHIINISPLRHHPTQSGIKPMPIGPLCQLITPSLPIYNEINRFFHGIQHSSLVSTAAVLLGIHEELPFDLHLDTKASPNDDITNYVKTSHNPILQTGKNLTRSLIGFIQTNFDQQLEKIPPIINAKCISNPNVSRSEFSPTPFNHAISMTFNQNKSHKALITAILHPTIHFDLQLDTFPTPLNLITPNLHVDLFFDRFRYMPLPLFCELSFVSRRAPVDFTLNLYNDHQGFSNSVFTLQVSIPSFSLTTNTFSHHFTGDKYLIGSDVANEMMTFRHIQSLKCFTIVTCETFPPGNQSITSQLLSVLDNNCVAASNTTKVESEYGDNKTTTGYLAEETQDGFVDDLLVKAPCSSLSISVIPTMWDPRSPAFPQLLAKLSPPQHKILLQTLSYPHCSLEFQSHHNPYLTAPIPVPDNFMRTIHQNSPIRPPQSRFSHPPALNQDIFLLSNIFTLDLILHNNAQLRLALKGHFGQNKFPPPHDKTTLLVNPIQPIDISYQASWKLSGLAIISPTNNNVSLTNSTDNLEQCQFEGNIDSLADLSNLQYASLPKLRPMVMSIPKHLFDQKLMGRGKSMRDLINSPGGRDREDALSNPQSSTPNLPPAQTNNPDLLNISPSLAKINLAMISQHQIPNHLTRYLPHSGYISGSHYPPPPPHLTSVSIFPSSSSQQFELFDIPNSFATELLFEFLERSRLVPLLNKSTVNMGPISLVSQTNPPPDSQISQSLTKTTTLATRVFDHSLPPLQSVNFYGRCFSDSHHHHHSTQQIYPNSNLHMLPTPLYPQLTMPQHLQLCSFILYPFHPLNKFKRISITPNSSILPLFDEYDHNSITAMTHFEHLLIDLIIDFQDGNLPQDLHPLFPGPSTLSNSFNNPPACDSTSPLSLSQRSPFLSATSIILTETSSLFIQLDFFPKTMDEISQRIETLLRSLHVTGQSDGDILPHLKQLLCLETLFAIFLIIFENNWDKFDHLYQFCHISQQDPSREKVSSCFDRIFPALLRREPLPPCSTENNCGFFAEVQTVAGSSRPPQRFPSPQQCRDSNKAITQSLTNDAQSCHNCLICSLSITNTQPPPTRINNEYAQFFNPPLRHQNQFVPCSCITSSFNSIINNTSRKLTPIISMRNSLQELLSYHYHHHPSPHTPPPSKDREIRFARERENDLDRFKLTSNFISQFWSITSTQQAQCDLEEAALLHYLITSYHLYSTSKICSLLDSICCCNCFEQDNHGGMEDLALLNEAIICKDLSEVMTVPSSHFPNPNDPKIDNDGTLSHYRNQFTHQSVFPLLLASPAPQHPQSIPEPGAKLTAFISQLAPTAFRYRTLHLIFILPHPKVFIPIGKDISGSKRGYEECYWDQFKAKYHIFQETLLKCLTLHFPIEINVIFLPREFVIPKINQIVKLNGYHLGHPSLNQSLITARFLHQIQLPQPSRHCHLGERSHCFSPQPSHENHSSVGNHAFINPSLLTSGVFQSKNLHQSSSLTQLYHSISHNPILQQSFSGQNLLISLEPDDQGVPSKKPLD